MQQLTLMAPAAPVAPYQVRLADVDSDRSEVLRLCRASALHIAADKYQWNYVANPLGHAWCSLVIESASRSAVGTTALFPRRILIDGMPFDAAVSGDFAVDPRHRTVYAALELQRAAVAACRSGTFDVLYGFPNDAARAVQIRVGYRVAGRVRVGIRPLRLRRALGQAGREINWLPGMSIFDSLVRFGSKESRVQIPTQYRFCLLARFDERFNRFWARTLPRYRVAVERSAGYANWRFISCPNRKYSLFAAINSDTGEIGGYILSWSDQGRIYISDIMACDDVFDGMLTLFIGQQRELGADCITVVFFGGSSLARNIWRFGFLVRNTRSEVLFYANPDLAVTETLSCPRNWYLLDGDSDF